MKSNENKFQRIYKVGMGMNNNQKVIRVGESVFFLS